MKNKNFDSESFFLPKRFIFQEAPPEQEGEKSEIEAYRDKIDEMSPSELKLEVKKQNEDLNKKEQVLKEILEDLNDPKQNIDQKQKNELIEEITAALAKNKEIKFSNEELLSLGSHYKAETTQEWMTKMKLMGGAMLKMYLELDPLKPGEYFDKAWRLMEVAFSLMKGESISPEGIKSTVEGDEKTEEKKDGKPEKAAEEKPKETPEAEKKEPEKLTDYEILSDDYKFLDQGFIAFKTKEGEKRYVKYDGSEIRNEKGENIEEKNKLAEQLSSSEDELSKIAANIEITGSLEKKTELAKALVEYQQIENEKEQGKPEDIGKLLNAEWKWLTEKGPFVGSDNNDKLRELLRRRENKQQNRIINILIQHHREANEKPTA